MKAKVFDVIVIGGGQAGLSVGHHLKRRGLDFVILDANARIGDAWRQRWDSLRLFSPARYDGLDGMPFPGPPDAFPTKDEMADYLEAYAAHFELPVRCGARVQRLSRDGDRYVVDVGDAVLEARHVVIAMASYQGRKVPPFAKELAPDVVQLHSSEYRGPSQLQPGGVLIVGAGNSGAEIAMETVAGHPTWVSGRDTGEVPFRPKRAWMRRLFLAFLFRFLFHRVFTVKTSIGRKVRAKTHGLGTPLIRQSRGDLAAAGVGLAPRTIGAAGGRPLLEDGRPLDVRNVIWCTGFDAALSWIDLPIFDEHGEPRHASGVVTDEPGLYFVGQHFQHAMSSAMIHGVGRDAARMVDAIAERHATTARAAAPLAQAAA